ncbi:MAG: hypothetical protein AABX73_03790 [Nanoarchaeota archaeon]
MNELSEQEIEKADSEGAESLGVVKPSWIKIKPAELEKVVLELAKRGETPAKIGLLLRDKHGVPSVKLFGKRITKIIKSNDVKYKSEKDILDGHIGKLKNHISKNKHDYTASRSLSKKLWVLHKFEKQ